MKLNSKIPYYIVSAIMVIGIAFLINGFKSKLELELKQLNADNDLSKYVLSNHLINANSTIDFKFDKNILVEDENFDKVKLASLISGENALILRISETHCNACDEAGLKSLLNNKSQIKNKDIIIIGSFYNTRLLNSLKEEHGIKQKMYNLKQSINFKIDELNFPYFLVLNKDLEVLSCFFPEKTMVDLTDDYFYGIQHLFNTKE